MHHVYVVVISGYMRDYTTAVAIATACLQLLRGCLCDCSGRCC